MDNIIYNPEGSLLRHDQMELLKMVKVFDKICKEHNIQWWLSSGTLLGAARHQGFIPWDDDMDIVLLRKDYIKLEKILCNYKNEEYVFHCNKTDIDYINVFGKFRKKKGKVRSASKRYDYYKWAGIGFDIFSIEKTNSFAAKVANIIHNRLQSYTIHIKSDFFRHATIWFIETFCRYIIYPVLRLIGKYNPKQEYHYELGTGWPAHTFFMKYTFPLAETLFEGEYMPVPKDMDAYLTNVYGDWRKLPSPEDIKKSIHCQEYRDEIYGENNKK